MGSSRAPRGQRSARSLSTPRAEVLQLLEPEPLKVELVPLRQVVAAQNGPSENPPSASSQIVRWMLACLSQRGKTHHFFEIRQLELRF